MMFLKPTISNFFVVTFLTIFLSNLRVLNCSHHNKNTDNETHEEESIEILLEEVEKHAAIRAAICPPILDNADDIIADKYTTKLYAACKLHSQSKEH